MNYYKKTPLSVGLFLVLSLIACDQKPSTRLNLDMTSPNASRFQTIAEAPNKEPRPADFAGDDKPADTSTKTEDFLPADGGTLPQGGPVDPPVVTDDDLIQDHWFGGGPLVVPFARCGDGIRQPYEQCDDGNSINTDGCNILCGKPFCGNGVTEANEMCDDGNNEDGDGCSSRCQFERCGNAILDPGEQCDDGNKANVDGCSSCCKYEYCGNAVIDPGEQCDDGNTTNGDGCSDCCLRETT